ncbi:RNA polymerase sigma factor (sigma-70 family) [Mucilaginibacter gracilis]|uniref:RNA polymerase sigma factor (Sigma-70 family) n=1 Tax=Mucilaginibacter gracilis TaxID=423350 RepID=A0A495J3I0_9SPHI|nr:sigma-70 family RNA polymerase sigma factor [Mucilaginibacter gracilis]RKR83383.1 RNA polymerase sigma factor (sigma-70 family) [Mucilaginibacter gracilis]
MSANQQNESALLQAWQNGDERAFDRIFQLHFYKLLRFATGYTKNAELAKEMVMDVMLKTWQKKETLNFGADGILPFLFHLLQCALIDQYRKKRIELLAFDDDTARDPVSADRADDRLHYRELTNLYREGLQQLSPQRRLVLEMRHEQGMSRQEIADCLNISNRTVNRHLTDAFIIVRQFLREKGDIALLLAITLLAGY